ncbi:MAG TPA: transposase [Candidatus Woesebacteria bacterium]|nr:transposase [Candidatus Woesebacteria bacterium]
MYGKRRSIRLEGYDYFRNGLYFVTIDLESKKNLFWKEINKFELNEMGMLAEKCWLDLEMRFNIKLDEYVIMPNHIHGILRINRATTRVARTLNSNVGAGFMPARDVNINHAKNIANELNSNVGAGFMPARNNLGNIIGVFKSIFVWEYIQNVKNQNWPRFFKRLWQRNYYERIIRNEKEYLAIKNYIRNNPDKLLNTKNPPAAAGGF